MNIIQNHINQTNHSSENNLNHDFNKINKMNRICITSLRGTKQSRFKINEITNNSGLPRRSYLTARNDEVPFYSHVSRHCGLDPQSPCSLQGIPHCVRNDGGAFRQKNKPQPKSPPEGDLGGLRLISGLPRRSCLTARNDDLPFYSHVSRHCGFDPQSPCSLQGIPHCVRNDGGEFRQNKPQPKSPPEGDLGGLRLISGLPRRSCLTARNDEVPFSSHVSRHCEVRSNPENHSLHFNQTNHRSDKKK